MGAIDTVNGRGDIKNGQSEHNPYIIRTQTVHKSYKTVQNRTKPYKGVQNRTQLYAPVRLYVCTLLVTAKFVPILVWLSLCCYPSLVSHLSHLSHPTTPL